MIVNMCILFYLFFVITNNLYVKNFLNDIQGMDERNFTNEIIISDKELLENFYKKDLLDKLSNNNYSLDEKINMISNWRLLEDKLSIEDIKSLNIKAGWLMNDWEFEQF